MRAMIFCLLLGAGLFSGCWITYSWRDYLPITSVNLIPGTRSYSGSFTPVRSGHHLLALNVQKHHDIPIVFNLHMKGEVVVAHCDGTTTRYEVDKFIGEYYSPPAPYDVYLTEFVAERCTCGRCVSKFNVAIDGDVVKCLGREPNSSFIIRFAESE